MEGGRKVKSGIPGPGVRYVAAAAAASYKMAGGGALVSWVIYATGRGSGECPVRAQC